MRKNITRMPGINCVHHMQGRCLLEERRNPGLHDEWQCQVLGEWEKAYDQFLNQAENFQLDLETATRIWAGRLGSMLRQPTPCECYQRGPDSLREGQDEDVLGCIHGWAGLCLLAMPRCAGVCGKYEHRQLDFGAEMS